jgi:hypothetical protein
VQTWEERYRQTSTAGPTAQDQRRREQEWLARFEQRQAELTAQAEAQRRDGAMAAERARWAEGKRGGQEDYGYVEVTGPDAEPVRIGVVWLGRFRAVARAFRTTGGGPVGLVDPYAIVILVAFGLVLLANFAVRWALLRLTGRPRWAVVVAVGAGGEGTVVLRGRDRAQIARAAAALADRVEQEGASAATGPRVGTA